MSQLALFGPAVPCLDPLLKWAGGKRWLLSDLRLVWAGHQHRRLVEPFCGGMAITLGLRPVRALLNDVNPHLINFYRCVSGGGLAADTPMVKDEATYYANRDRFNGLITKGQADSQQGATLFYYLVRSAFNGLCRFNSRGEFNTPIGDKPVTYRREFPEYAEAFAAWEFTMGDFELMDLRSDDFIYADPPYDEGFTEYSAGGFGWADQVRTAEWLAGHSGPVVLSNLATDRIVALYQRLGFAVRFLNAPRRIACTGDRTPAREVLATRNI